MLFLLFLDTPRSLQDFSCPTREWTCRQWKHWVLTIGWPGNSHNMLFLMDKFVKLMTLILTHQFKTSGKYYEKVQIKFKWLSPSRLHIQRYMFWASLVAQWLRICLLMRGTRVRALVWEDPTCCGATRPVSHNYWACASGACAPQQERPR